MKITLSIPGYGTVDPGTVPTASANKIVWTFIDLILIIAVLLSAYYILKGGWDIITSEGRKEQINNARKEIVFAVLGLLLIFLSFLFINTIGSSLGINFLSLPF